MADQGTDDWLPPGWTVDVRVRRSGKKDRHYYSPDGVKYFSKHEVLRYLKTVQCSSQQRKDEKNISFEQSFKSACDGIARRNCLLSEEDKKANHDQFAKNSCDNTIKNSSPQFKEEEKIGREHSPKDVSCNIVDSGSTTLKEEDKVVLEQSTQIGCGDAVASSLPLSKESIAEQPQNMVCSENTEKFSTPTREENRISHKESSKNVCSNTQPNSTSTFEEEKIFSLEGSAKDVDDNNLQSASGNSKQKSKARRHQPTKNVVFETVVAEGLPEGWIKKIKVTKKNNTVVRRDPYYTDPVSGYVFRSMKDVLRYLETGEIGRLAFKPKDKDESDADVEEDNIAEPTVIKKRKLGDNEPESTEDQGLKQCNSMMEKHTSTLSHLGECMPASECVGGTDTGSLGNLDVKVLEQTQEKGNSGHSDAKDLEQSQEKSSSGLRDGADLEQNQEKNNGGGTDLLPLHGATILSEESPRNTVVTQEKKETPVSGRKSRKKEINLPRRTSKRLAGVAVDPTLEITTNRANRGLTKHFNQEEASQPNNSAGGGCTVLEAQCMDQFGQGPDTKCTTGAEESKDQSMVVAAHKEDAENLEGNYRDDQQEKRGTVSLLPNSLSIAREDFDKVESINRSEEKPFLPFDLPSQDILADPCIEFAIKTLTGISFDSSENPIQLSTSGNSPGDSAPSSVHCKKMEIERVDDEKQGFGIVLPSEKVAHPERHAGRVNSEENASEVPASSQNVPFGDSWTDPCIEFAIKTLTGAIPVEYGLDVHDLIQQQMRSSQIQENSDLNLSNAGVDNFCRTDLLWQHSDAAVKPVYRNQAGLVPTTPHTGNVDFRRSSGGVQQQQRQDRSNKCRR